jgi:Tol biopolymer transport system component
MATTIAPGTKLGPYEIEALIGAGGMGEVYRARDERLAREVALKVLPAAYAEDAERLHRFEQEARATGQLNHPGILAIYDVGTGNGVPYIVTELLEGQNLRRVVSHGPLAPQLAVGYAIQITAALAAAHAKGITHRDLKPENLFILPAGRVKILDFGLAKLQRPFGITAEEQTRSLQASLTATGTVMGTASYMAPEQIREQPVDHRADIFSVGCILYEMLAGKRAFDGETPMDRMTAILHVEPPDLPRAVEEAAPGIGKVIKRALEKKAHDRFETARELSFALELVSERSGIAREGGDSGESARPVTPATLRRLTYREGTIYNARFAPDGQSVYYGAAWEGHPIELFWAHRDNPESRSLGLSRCEILAVAPSGEMAISLQRYTRGGFIRSGMLARMPIGGGAPRELLEDVQEADWSPDGRNLAVIRDVGGMSRVEFPIGKILYQSPGWQSQMRISPDGKRIAFLDHTWRGNDAGSVAVVDLEGNFKILSAGWPSTRGLAWWPDGREIWFTAYRTEASRALYAVTLDGAQRRVFQTAGHLILEDISRQGHVLVNHGTERMRMQIRALGEERARDLTWLDWSMVRDVSPDGKRVLFDETGVAGGEFHAVYMRDADGSPAVKLGEGIGPRFSPDGRWALTIQEGTPPRILLLPTGAGETRIVKTGRLHCHNILWFPDGERICGAANEGSGLLRLYEIPLGAGSPRVFSDEGVSGVDFLMSPDGTFVCARGPDLSFNIYPVDGSPARPITAVGVLERPFGWNADGSALFAFERGVLPSKIFRIEVATGRRELFRELSPSDPTGVEGLTMVRMTPDESTFVYSYPQGLIDLFLIEGLR